MKSYLILPSLLCRRENMRELALLSGVGSDPSKYSKYTNDSRSRYPIPQPTHLEAKSQELLSTKLQGCVSIIAHNGVAYGDRYDGEMVIAHIK